MFLDRHAATLQVARWFSWEHLPEDLARISAMYGDLAARLVTDARIPDSPEFTIALRKLLEAKDAAVRAALLAEE